MYPYFCPCGSMIMLMIMLTRGAVSRKSRKLFRPEKPAVKLPTACLGKHNYLLTCFQGNKMKNNCEV